MTDIQAKPNKEILRQFVSATLQNHALLMTSPALQSGDTGPIRQQLTAGLINTFFGVLTFISSADMKRLYQHTELQGLCSDLTYENEDYAIEYENPAAEPAEQLVFFILERLRSAISQGNIKVFTDADTVIQGVRFADFQNDKFRDYTKRSFRILLSFDQMTRIVDIIKTVLT